MEAEKGKSLSETPTWAVSGVVSVMVLIGFSINASLKHFGKWLDRTKRKSLLAALDKIKEELMLFGLLSLLMGHWIIYAAKICVKSSAINTRFYPCSLEKSVVEPISQNHISFSPPNFFNYSISRQQVNHPGNEFCPEGSESFASKESLEQLHRFLFVLGVTHVSYSFFAIALAMIKIYSWRTWENQAMSMAILASQGSTDGTPNRFKMRRLSTFIYHHTAHPWSQHKIFVWLICFSRQFWSSINRADYRALRLGFLTTHHLPLSYDFHNYMLRSMEEEFRDIVGISAPLWIFAISCILLGFHGTNVYFWMSFLPAILILLVGTKLHRIVIKLAVEIMHTSQWTEFHQFNLRDELFWFGKPRILLRLIQFISFQNAFEMATCIWSLWEVKDPSCFTKNHSFLVTRLAFGLVSQFWCSFITFPLYVIVTQMGSKFKKSIVSENVRESLHKWRRRVKARRGDGPSFTLTTTTSATSLDSMVDEIERTDTITSSSIEGCSSRYEDTTISNLHTYIEEGQTHELSTDDEKLDLVPLGPGPPDDITCDDEHAPDDITCDDEHAHGDTCDDEHAHDDGYDGIHEVR